MPLDIEKIILIFRRSAHILYPLLWPLFILFLFYAPINLFFRISAALFLICSAFYYLEFWRKGSKLMELEEAIYIGGLDSDFADRVGEDSEWMHALANAKEEGRRHFNQRVRDLIVH